MSEEIYLVETTLGNTLLPRGTWYLSHVAQRVFVKKLIEDITPGEMVIYEKEFINKTLGEIEPYLEQSVRYRSALDKIFLKNNQGERIPVFRRDLIQAVASNSIITQDTLNEKIMRENGNDFSHDEYAAMSRYLFERLNDICDKENLPNRSEGAIRGWLDGSTLAPSDWNLFYALELALGGKGTFDDYFAPLEKNDSYERNYRLYTVTRREIMSYLSKFQGNSKKVTQKKGGKNDEEKIYLAPEINIVVGQFMRDIDDQNSIARVTGKKIIESRNGNQYAEDKIERKLRKGVVTQEKGSQYKTTNMLEIDRERHVFGEIFVSVIRDYIKNYMKEPPKNFIISAIRRLMLHMDGIDYNRVSTKQYITDLKNLSNNTYSKLMNIAEKIHNDMTSGDMDSYFDLNHGTIYRAYEHIMNSLRVIPDSLFDAHRINYELIRGGKKLARSDRREKERELKKLEKTLLRTYGIGGFEDKALLSEGLTASADLINQKNEIEFTGDPELLKKIILERVGNIKDLLIGKEEVVRILAKYDLKDLMRFIHPNNFIFDPDFLNFGK